MTNHDHDFTAQGEYIEKDTSSGIMQSIESRKCILCDEIEVFSVEDLF